MLPPDRGGGGELRGGGHFIGTLIPLIHIRDIIEQVKITGFACILPVFDWEQYNAILIFHY